MTDINLKTLTPDTSLPTTGFLFGADSQASTNPSVYSTQTVATTLLGSTSLTGDTLTASAPVLNLAQTWNNGAVTFTGIKLNVTDTASVAGSRLFDIQTNTTSLLYFSPIQYGSLVFGGAFPRIAANNFSLCSTPSLGAYYFDMAGAFLINTTAGSSNYVAICAKANANIRFGLADAASPIAQTLSVQSVVAGTSSTAGADFTLTGSQNTGAGLAGNLIVSTGFSNTVGTATVTITIATPGVITWTAHGLVTGSPVVFTTTGALPTGITAGTTYFAITSSTLGVNTFQIATSAANAAAGTAITTSGTQSGVQTATTSATVQSPLMTTTTFGPSGLTGSQTTPLLDLKQNWNTSGNATGLKLNITNTASGNGSLPFVIQFNGVDWFSINKPGQGGISIGNSSASGSITAINSASGASTVQIVGSTTGGLLVSKDQRISWQSTAQLSGSDDLFLTRKGIANLQLGAADAASPVAQTLSVQSVVAGQTDASAAAYPFTINGAQGTGGGAGGSIVFKVAPAGGSGTSQNTLQTALTIDSGGTSTFITTKTGNADAGSFLAPNIGVGNTTFLSLGRVSSPNDLASFGFYFAGSGSSSNAFTLAFHSTGSIWGITANTTNTLMFLGGQTSSFPALKRSSTTLQARLADDSAFASVQGKLTTDNAYTAGAVVQTGYVTIYDSTGTAYKVLVGT